MTFNDNKYLHRMPLHISGSEVIGKDLGLRSVMDMVRKVAPLDSPVLLLGETGVGKEVVANAIHITSTRMKGPFIKVNCGAIPEHLVDSELFGHERGAFTGAVTRKRGRFERAHGGTIFLDEIGELSHPTQVRLLRVLQHKEIERVGGEKPTFVDIRIISATHQNLESMVSSNKFRKDLFYRLNVYPIVIPPLRERKGDIHALVHHFLGRKSKEMNIRLPPEPATGSDEWLINYDWPGNVRELENIVERALIHCQGGGALKLENPAFLSHNLPISILQRQEREMLKLDEMIALYIRRALEITDGKIYGPGGAAEILGINPSTLRKKMVKLDIPFKGRDGSRKSKLLQ